MHRNAIARRARGLRQPFAKLVVPFVGDADPVNRAHDDRFPRADDHDAPAAERQFVEPFHRIVSHRRTQRRCGIHIKRRDFDALRFVGLNGGQGDQ